MSSHNENTQTMTLEDAIHTFYADSDDYDFEKMHNSDEHEELRRLWRLELNKCGMRVRPGEIALAANPHVARTALAFALHGMQAYMVRKGWDKIDRANEMGLTYLTAGDLNKMRNRGEVPDLNPM